MQQALPEDLWFFIIVMALLILAYLWNDRGSSGGKKKRKKRKTPEPEEPETPEEPPDIRIARRGSTTPGEECWIKASFTTGTGEVQSLKAEINGQEVGIRERQGNAFISNPAEVQEGENRLKASIKTDVATKTDSTTFPAGERVPDDEEGPTLLLDYNIVDERNGHVQIEADARRGSAPIVQTAISLSTRDRTVGGNSDNSDYCEFEAEGLPPGNYVIDAVTQDENSLTNEKTETFTLEDTSGPGPGEPTGPEGGGGYSGIPNVFNPQIEASPEINLDVPEEAIHILQDIVGEVDREAPGDVSQEVGMEGYQILMAMHMLQNDLDGDDNRQIVEELERIRESLGQGQVSENDLESSLRAVLHDVFGQDLQDVLEGLEVNGFDEEAIVQAINENNVDLEPLAARLSDIEQAVGQLESQGTDLTDIEQRLDSIEEAVEESGGFDRTAVNPMAMTRDPEESGSGGNKNEESVKDRMAKANTLQHIDQAESALENLKEEQSQIEDDLQDAHATLQDLQNNLHDAIKHENHLDNVLDDNNLKNPNKIKENYQSEIQQIKEDIKAAIKDYRRFEGDVEEISRLVDEEEDGTNQLQRLDEAVGTSIQHVEQLAEKVKEAYGVELDTNPQVNFN
ncbi:hypothetical protein ACK3SF_00455 [Candidatus Nanosalina sp. VS9-1]|uniref:hypothetical protein n=1 Tax=Candidatus Nanosalina sp. VS9-1 TaxID=3388566 RepID=UPI0039E109E4